MALIDDQRAAAQAGVHAGTAPRIRAATRDDATGLATTLAAAFYDDPVFRYCIPDDGRRSAVLPRLFDVFVDAYVAHGDTHTAADTAGTALWAAPRTAPLDAQPGYGERIAELVGSDAERLFDVVERFEARTPQTPHYHLQFLAVRPERQGRGLGAAVMAPGLERCDRDGVPAYLEATSERNRALYERHGFRACGSVPLPDGPTVCLMWREPGGPERAVR